MKLIKTTSIPIRKLRLPGDWRAFQRSPAVAERAAQLKDAQPIVRASDNRLLSGKVEVAASAAVGLEEIMAKFVECSDEEATTMQVAEDGGDPTLAVLRRLSSELLESGDADRERGPGGPTKSARGIARAAIAAKQGLKPETIRMREYRASKKAPPIVLKDLGMTLDPTWLEQVKEIQDQLDAVCAKVQAAKGALTRLLRGPAQVPARFTRLLEELSALSAALIGARPSTLCPYCKGVDKVQKECAACEGLGYLTESQEAGVPPEFLSVSDIVVLYRGATVNISEFDNVEATEVDPTWPL